MSAMKEAYAAIEREQARYIILDMLRAEPDGRLNLPLIHRHLKSAYGIGRPLEWVHDQLRWLASVDAVVLHDVGLVVAELSARGQQHLDRDARIPGIQPPPRPGA
jgi:hypothetical protein